jgi:short-subunit dehydrogenase
MNSIKSDKKLAVITGASSGLGEEFSRQIALQGKFNLLLVARRAERLERLKLSIENELRLQSINSEIRVYVCDLGKTSDLEALSIALAQEQIGLLVNNAGFGSVGGFLSANLAKEHEMIDLNCKALIALTHAVLPQMYRDKSGVVINVASTASFQALPYMATYGATKAFVLSHSLSLAVESKKFGVQFLALCPGPTETEFHLVAGLPEKMSYLPAMSAVNVVRQGLDAVERGYSLKINGVTNWLLATIARLLPPTVSARIVERVLRAHR